MLDIVKRRYWYFGISLLIIVPGLIAHQWYRQGFLPTFLTLAIAATITRTLAVMTMAVLQ